MDKTIRWGIIGCGSVTEKKSGPAFQKVENSTLTAVMRRSLDKAEDFARRHNVPYFFSDAHELINHPEVDAVYVATPPNTHAQYAVDVMRAGKPVYVEKPMACTFEECQKMVRVSQETQQPLWVAYYRRALPGFVKVKDLIEQKTIGEILSVSIELFQHHGEEKYQEDLLPWRVVPEIAGGGLFYDLASHTLDYLDLVLGPISEAHGVACNHRKLYKAEEMVSGSFLFSNGVVGNGTWNFACDYSDFKDSVKIVGTHGSISFSTFQFTPIQVNVKGEIISYDYPRPEHVQMDLIRSIVRELNGKGVCLSRGESAARTNFIMEKITQSYYTEG